MQLAAMTNYNQVNLLDKKDFRKGKTQSKRKPGKGRGGHKGKEPKQTDKSKSGCGRRGGAPHDNQRKCPAINSKCFNCYKVEHYQHMCFKTKPSGANALHGEATTQGNLTLMKISS